MIYDQFQQKAIDYINDNFSVIVSAPTGAGKTVIAEHVINDCLKKNTKAVYTAPIKALSNQKYREFQQVWKDKIGILTGDVSINPSAPILIMTTEIFRNKILEEKSDLAEYSWIIFDEIHYIDDYERGTVWEESLIFLPQHMNVLALSATIPNIDEFAAWIQSIHKRPFKVVKEERRPVPLHFFYQCQGEIADDLNKVKRLGFKGRHPYHYRSRRYEKHTFFKPNRPVWLIRHLAENNRLPCIYFSFGRRRCERLAEEMKQFDFLSPQEKSIIKSLYNELCEKFDLVGEKSASILAHFIENGIAYHHAGMLPTLKEVVEQLFTSRLIKVIFTTETFALGINMPARTVVFDELRKYYGRFFKTLKTRDFYQMAGRSGRRGIDKEGFVYSRVNPRQISFQELTDVIYRKPEKVQSRFNISYATILNLYEKHAEKIYDIYPLSFHHFQETGHSHKMAIEIVRSKLNILKELGYIKKGVLTQKGHFAGRIYGYELSLSELYSSGVFDGLSEIELGILCLALVFEPRKGTLRPKLTKVTKAMYRMTSEVTEKIHKKEKKARITPLSKSYCFYLATCLELWMRNESFDTILRHTDVDEGEVIRNFRMCLQILREILDTPTLPNLKGKIRKSISLINRDIIDAEKQLRK